MKDIRYNVWCRSIKDPVTRWYPLDDSTNLPEGEAVKKAKDGQVATEKFGTNLEYRAVPIGGRPS